MSYNPQMVKKTVKREKDVQKSSYNPTSKQLSLTYPKSVTSYADATGIIQTLKVKLSAQKST